MRLGDSERGAVALISVIITAVLISIITTGLSRGLSNEARQTTDINESSRAFYAAEAGVEDALQRIKDHSTCPTSNPGCDVSDLYYYTETDGVANDAFGNPLSPVRSPVFRHVGVGDDLGSATQSDDPGAVWIHRYVKLTSQESEGLLKRDESMQLDFSTSGISRITIEWDVAGDSKKTSGWLANFPSNWAESGEPALLEATLVSWNETGGQVTSFDPVRKHLGRACMTNNTCPDSLPSGMQITHQPASQYHFKWEITGTALDPAKLYVLRLKSWFAPTHYRVTAYNTGGQLVELPENFITIDVTGKSGDTYRRLVVKKRYQAEIFSVFDFALASEQAMCKSFTLYGDFSLDQLNCQ